LVGAGERSPLLDPEQVVLFAWGPEQATEFEAEAIAQRAIATVPVGDVAADPEGAATRALAMLEPRCDRLLVHFDVDVVDFTDTPLSENWGRNEGLAFETALRALGVLLSSPLLAGLTITELNPDHTEEGGGAIERLVEALAAGLGTC
jgi:arginase